MADAETHGTKRPLEDTTGEPAAKKAKPNNVVYTVTFTNFLDDYKARGSDWSDSSAPKLFSTYAKADKYVDRELLRRVTNYLDEREDDEDYAEYWHAEGEVTHDSDDEDEVANGDGSTKKKRVLARSKVQRDLYELAEKAQEGEFVSKTFDYAINEEVVDAWD